MYYACIGKANLPGIWAPFLISLGACDDEEDAVGICARRPLPLLGATQVGVFDDRAGVLIFDPHVTSRVQNNLFLNRINVLTYRVELRIYRQTPCCQMPLLAYFRPSKAGRGNAQGRLLTDCGEALGQSCALQTYN